MTTQKIITLYQYDELSEEAKLKALEWASEFAADYEWWDFDGLTAWTVKELKQYHLPADAADLLTYKSMAFDIDRGGYLQFVDPCFTDSEVARLFLGIPRRTWAKVSHYFPRPSREGCTSIDFEIEDIDRPLTAREEVIIERAKDRFTDKVADCLIILRRCYEGLFERESLEDTIRANEYTFLEDGTRE